MPQRTKKILRRKVAQAFQHQQRTVEIMLELAEMFSTHHPDYEEMLQAIAQSAFVTMGFIQSVAIKAWGYWPDDIDSWLK